MEKYIALLRGINIGGKNKIVMKELKSAFEELDFKNVVTFINSGNVIFSSDENNKQILIKKIETKIKNSFNLDIPVTVVSVDRFNEIFLNAPEWWNTDDKEIYHTIIFVIPPFDATSIYEVIGDAKTEYEKILLSKDLIYWSASLKDFQKSRWSKIASTSINNKVTVRTANTVRKLLDLASKI